MGALPHRQRANLPRERLNDVPAAVSAIVMKLLAKTAEERYQTATGVEADLRRCLDAVRTSSSSSGAPRTSGNSSLPDAIPEFSLGEYDVPDRLLIPEKLYGRAREIDTLLGSFDRVLATGRPELVLVSGYSGIGKSSVVNELHASCNGQFRLGRSDHRCRCALAVVRIDSAARSDAGEQLVVRGARDHCAQRLADTGHTGRPNRADGLCRRNVWTSPCQCVT